MKESLNGTVGKSTHTHTHTHEEHRFLSLDIPCINFSQLCYNCYCTTILFTILYSNCIYGIFLLNCQYACIDHNGISLPVS